MMHFATKTSTNALFGGGGGGGGFSAHGTEGLGLGDTDMRRRTFRKWPHKEFGREFVAKLAIAGLFFNPTPSMPDRCTCYACSSSFCEWEKNDDPIQEHFKSALGSNCPHLMQLLPSAFSNKLGGGLDKNKLGQYGLIAGAKQIGEIQELGENNGGEENKNEEEGSMIHRGLIFSMVINSLFDIGGKPSEPEDNK